MFKLSRLWNISELVKEIFFWPRKTKVRIVAKREPKIFGGPYEPNEAGDVLLLWDFSQRLKTPDVRRTVSGGDVIRLLILTERDGSL